MKRWRRRRLLRLHLVGQAPSIEGVFLGFEAGHYRLVKGLFLETAQDSHDIVGETWVPRERVLYAQVIG